MLHSRLENLNGVSEWKCSGELGLLDKPAGAILLSRQSRRPRPGEWWLRATVEVARMLAGEGRAIICGGGILHLDFARWAAHREGEAIWLDVPGGGAKRVGQGTPDWCDLRIEPALSGRAGKKETMTARDKWAVEMADKVVAVAVRAGGNMEELCRRAIGAGKEVVVVEPPRLTKATRGAMALIEAGATPLQLTGIEIPKKKPDSGETQRAQAQQLSLGVGDELALTPDELKDYLWHFTRECAGPWPDRNWDDYFADLAAGLPEAAHDAVDSLEHILRSGVIKACGDLVRGACEVVCWSAASPLEIASKPTYRPALGRWNFKPYAVGIKRDVAARLGAREVVYGDEEDYRNLPESERFLFQLASTKTADWRRESEWRTQGDFHLGEIDTTDALALVKTPHEKSRIELASSFAVISLEEL